MCLLLLSKLSYFSNLKILKSLNSPCFPASYMHWKTRQSVSKKSGKALPCPALAIKKSCSRTLPHIARIVDQQNGKQSSSSKPPKPSKWTDSSGLVGWHEGLCGSSWWTMKWWNANLVVLFGWQRCAALLHFAAMSLLSGLLLQVLVVSPTDCFCICHAAFEISCAQAKLGTTSKKK